MDVVTAIVRLPSQLEQMTHSYQVLLIAVGPRRFDVHSTSPFNRPTFPIHRLIFPAQPEPGRISSSIHSGFRSFSSPLPGEALAICASRHALAHGCAPPTVKGPVGACVSPGCYPAPGVGLAAG